MNIRVSPQKTGHEYKLLNRVQIAASGMYLPPKIVKSDDLMREFDSYERYGIPINSISDKVGIIERRVAEPGELPSTLAINAARQALESAGIDRVDKLVFCGISKDQVEPATAHKINHTLRLEATEAYDINDACFGFIRGLQDCIRSIQLGEIKSALVVTGETPSKSASKLIEKLNKGVNAKEALRTIGFLTAGDAGGAILLCQSSPNLNSGFNEFITVTDSQLWDKCYYKHTSNGEIKGQMLMGPLTARGRKVGQKLVNKLKLTPGWSEPDHVLSHNTGAKSLECLKGFGLATHEKWYKTYSGLGNLMSATFPVNFHLQNEKRVFETGDKIGCIFNGSGLVFGYFSYTY